MATGNVVLERRLYNNVVLKRRLYRWGRPPMRRGSGVLPSPGTKIRTVNAIRRYVFSKSSAIRGPRGRRVGILGGSFNPAHPGHLSISLKALKTLRLDQIWWLVAPQNPLKTAEMALSFSSRVGQATSYAGEYARIIVLDLEEKAGWRFSHQTVAGLKKAFPDHAFVFLMGGDLPSQLPRWQAWEKLCGLIPFAIFARPTLPPPALSKMAMRYRSARLKPFRGYTIVGRNPPAWLYMAGRKDAHSGTDMRRNQKKEFSNS